MYQMTEQRFETSSLLPEPLDSPTQLVMYTADSPAPQQLPREIPTYSYSL